MATPAVFMANGSTWPRPNLPRHWFFRFCRARRLLRATSIVIGRILAQRARDAPLKNKLKAVVKVYSQHMNRTELGPDLQNILRFIIRLS